LNKTICENILSRHAGRSLKAGDTAEIFIDVRAARDFGGANVVNHLKNHGLGIAEPARTCFTFDCNSGGSDQKFAANQQFCRMFARERGIRVFDVDRGIGSHVVMEEHLVSPGDTFVSTDSHANIVGAVGAFGQGMGDQDIAAAFARGFVWFQVPPTVKISIKGLPPANTSAKDMILRLLQQFGPDGLLGRAAEVYGPVTDSLSLDSRITIASMATEMGGIILLFSPNQAIAGYYGHTFPAADCPAYAGSHASYIHDVEIDMSVLCPMISLPGHPDHAVPVSEVAGRKIDSAFIGSCTNGRYEDMKAAAAVLKGRKVAPGVVLKIVPATRQVWRQCLDDGLIGIFMDAGALVGNAGCAGCAAGQIGQNGPGEVTVSTSNRNYPGKQGRGDVYLASPATAASSAVAGVIASSDAIPDRPSLFHIQTPPDARPLPPAKRKPLHTTKLTGRIWVINKDNIDTDLIFHNRYLAVTDRKEMGQYALDNLEGWRDFSHKAEPGDMIVTGRNFGAGSSRQQAVDCFISLGIQAIVARSFGSIYWRNAVNAGLPVLTGDLLHLKNGEIITIDLKTGLITCRKSSETCHIQPATEIQMAIFRRGGLLNT